MKQKKIAKPYNCTFCGAGFMKERTLVNHLCEKKRRHMSKDETHVRIGFHAWIRWHELTNTRMKKNDNAYLNFSDSKLYIPFVKFGRHIVNTKIGSAEEFIKFVIKNSIRLDDWCKESIYNAFVRQNIRKEDIMTALARFVKVMENWANEHDENWNDFLFKVNVNIALNLIRTGKMSPWILLNAVHKDELINRMSDEQIMLVDKYIELQWWQQYMVRNKKDKRIIVEALKEYGI